MGPLRKAGHFLQKVDDAYSARIADMYAGANPGVQAAAYVAGGAHPSFRRGEVEGEGIAARAMEYAIPAANAVPKYVLPTVGVTLAGKALFDMGMALGAAAKQQTEGTLEP